MIADVLRMASVLNIRRTRQLPFPGQVFVSLGQDVSPEDVVAEALIPNGVLMLDIARGLSVSPSDALTFLVRDVGENLQQGDVIAENHGAFPRLVRMPVDAKFVEFHQGRAVLATENTPFSIKAGLFGSVEEVIPEHGVIISTRGSLVQGLWGNGQIGAGTLSVVDIPGTNVLDSSLLDTLVDDGLIFARLCLHADMLSMFEEKGCKGLVLGALAPELVPLAMNLSVPVVVLQGFGDLPPDPTMMAMFESHGGKMASINALETDPLSGHRPEVIISQVEGEPELELGFRSKLAVDQHVRVLTGKAKGQPGVVIELSSTPDRCESGLMVHLAVIRLQDGESISVPCQNLVILG